MFAITLHYSIIESLELERTFKGHLVQLLCSEQGHPQLDQGAQSPVQSDLECLQRQCIHHISGQAVSVLHHSYHKKLFHYIQSKSSFLYFETIFTCPVTTDSAEESVHFFLISLPLDTERPLSALWGAFFYSLC